MKTLKEYTLIFWDIEITEKEWMICFKTNNEWTIIKNDILELEYFLTKEKDSIFIGFNTKHFDEPILKAILEKQDAYSLAMNIIKDQYYKWWEHYKFNKLNNLFFDLKNSKNMAAYNLKEIGLNMGYPVFEAEGEFMNEDYCKNDVNITEALYNLLEKNETILSTKLYLIDYFKLDITHYIRTTNAIIVADGLNKKSFITESHFTYKCPKFIKDNCYEKTTQLINKIESEILKPTSEKEWIINLKDIICDVKLGGIHGSIKNETIESDEEYIILDIDGTSQYPFIMANPVNEELRFYPRACEDWSTIYHLIAERVVAKNTGNVALANCLKIIINTIYGIMGQNTSTLYDWVNCRNVCLTGELLICAIIEKFEHSFNAEDWRLLQANTDGFTIYVKKNLLPEIENICQEYKGTKGINWEIKKFTKFIIKNISTYIAIDENGKIKKKGKIFTNDTTNWNLCHHPIISKMIINNLLFKKTLHQTMNEAEAKDFCISVSRKGKSFDQTFHGTKPIPYKNNLVYVTNDEIGALGKRSKLTQTIHKFPNIGKNHVICNQGWKQLSIEELKKNNLATQWYVDEAMKELKSWNRA